MVVRSKRVAVRIRTSAIVGLSALLLAACGGGGGGGSPLAERPGPGPEFEASVAIAGTAATGAPLAGATISLKCSSGEFSTTADVDGAYRIASVPVDAAPCLLRAQQAATTYIAPIASLGAGTIIVNATPLTHLLSSRLLGRPADLVFQDADATTLALVDQPAVSAARGQVRAQIDRLGISAPGLSSDWIGTPFEARAGDPHDDLLEALRAALARHGLTVATAAGQLASNDAVLDLLPEQPGQACTPSLIEGFAGTDRQRWIRVGSGPTQTDGIGIAGGPGLTRGASVEVSFADGTLLRGARTDAVAGMVTLVPCGLKTALPALIRLRGEPGSTYYDAGSGLWTSFEGKELHGLVSGFEPDRNLAVTPFTEAVYQRVLASGADAGIAAGRLAPKAMVLSWHDPGRIEMAHDEVLAAVNDQLPGPYRLARLDRMALMLDEQADAEGSQALPGTQEGIHGAVIAGLAKAAAARRPDDPAPALVMGERLAADLADGMLDDPLAGLDASVVGATVPAYSIDSLWQEMTAATTSVARKAGRSEFRSDLPFPFALVSPDRWRTSILNQYVGLYSDGILRIVVEVPDHLVNNCASFCNPARKVRASAGSAWWIYEIDRLLDFDPDTRVGRRHDGSMVAVGFITEGEGPEAVLQPLDFAPVELFPNVRNAMSGGIMYRGRDNGIHHYFGGNSRSIEYADARGLRSLAGMAYTPSTWWVQDPTSMQDARFHLFGIDASGRVNRLVYRQPEFDDGRPISVALQWREEMDLPSRARQLTSDGRVVYALLANGDVYILNPEILASEMGSYPPQDGADPTAVAHSYVGWFKSAGLAQGVPLRIQGATNICRIDGVYLVTCGGQLRKIDRSYFWAHISISWFNLRAPGAEYLVVPDTRFDANGWRAMKAPMTQDAVGGESRFRLLATVDGSYVLQEDRHDARVGAGSSEVEGAELSRQVIESWLRTP